MVSPAPPGDRPPAPTYDEVPVPASSRRPRRLRAALTTASLGLTTALTSLALPVALGAAPAVGADATRLYLVTMDGPGLASTPPGPATEIARWRIRAQQDAVLARVDGSLPVYRYSAALNGLALELTAAEARDLVTAPGVALVEPAEIRRLAGRDPAEDPARLSPGGARRGGQGVTVGVVDTGLDPDTPLFTATARVSRAADGDTPPCAAEPAWGPGWCTDKVVAGHWFVSGFGRDRLSSRATLTPVDDVGHGTQVASIAAGNAGVPVRVRGNELGRYAGIAPDASVAVYKACWSAPDPADDGCSTADLVAAIDRAVADGVDVLNLSVAGPSTLDTVELALLGAAEADVVVVAAAGSDARGGTAHSSPWVTTVGAGTGVVRRGEVRLGGGTRLLGAMTSPGDPVRARLVRGADAAARGAGRAEARRCEPGSLDTAVVAGRVVVCERGGVGRVDKSQTVAEADGVGMVLVNAAPGGLSADLHAVPTVHLTVSDGRRLSAWAARHPRGRVVLAARPATRAVPRVLEWSSTGSPAAAYPKPDVVAPGDGVLGAVPGGEGWQFLSGTSAASAWVSGTAARLRAERGWSAAATRSALVTTAEPLPSGVLDSGAGRVRLQAADSPGLVLGVDPSDYREWLEGGRLGLNTTSLVVRGEGAVTRTVTNVGRRARYFSTSAVGFERHDVSVTPAALRLGPGESARITVRVARGDGTQEDGAVLLRGGAGTRTRLPLLVAR